MIVDRLSLRSQITADLYQTMGKQNNVAEVVGA